MGEQLRRILEESGGRYVSGQEIGLKLGTTRAAVWKRIQGLRRRGFGIEGARGAGYRLLGRPDVLEREELRSRLQRPSFWSGFHFLPVTDSTNSQAVALAERGGAHATVVCADAQTGGRGRMGRSWVSPPGVNLYLSLLLRPSVEPREAPRLTLVTAVALAQAVESTSGVRAGLKWPNDLLIDGRKAAGILAEMSSDPDRIRHVVIGVGLNVNADSSAFPAELRGTATSLFLATGRTYRRVEVLASFLDAFARCYGTFLSGGLAGLLPEWRRRDVLAGKRVVLRSRDAEWRGTALGVGEDGFLVFRRAGAARAERIASGEIVKIGGSR